MTNFEKAGEIVSGWPEDKTVPERLFAFYKSTDWDPEIGMTLEALYASADSLEDLELVEQAWKGAPNDPVEAT